MKILVIENSLDDLLNVKISVNGGQSYTDYNVSSLKNGGLTLDCNPSDLKVICDTNILNYIKVFADGEKLNTGSGSGSGSSFCQFRASYVGRGYSTAIVFSYDNVTSIQIESLENADGYEVHPNSGEHLYMIGEKVTSVKLVLDDGTIVNGVELV